jgi:hypothetical protein
MSAMEAYYGSIFYQNNISDRLDTIINVAQVTDLNIDFTQKHMNNLIENSEKSGFNLDPRIKWGILKRYEEMLDMKSLKKRSLVESLREDTYNLYRGDTQGALFI